MKVFLFGFLMLMLAGCAIPPVNINYQPLPQYAISKSIHQERLKKPIVRDLRGGPDNLIGQVNMTGTTPQGITITNTNTYIASEPIAIALQKALLISAKNAGFAISNESNAKQLQLNLLKVKLNYIQGFFKSKITCNMIAQIRVVGGGKNILFKRSYSVASSAESALSINKYVGKVFNESVNKLMSKIFSDKTLQKSL